MPIEPQKAPNRHAALEFKSGTFSVPVLVLSSNDMAIIEQQLHDKVRLAPEFFRNSPLVFDLQELNKKNLEIDIAELTGIIYKLGLLPIGIRGGNMQQNKNALELRIPIYSIHNNISAEIQKPANITPPPEAKTETTTTKLITQPVRSGQRIYSSGDLIILAQVSAGAEIMAEGNIHVYNSLRGRALAGVQGDTEARIFCTDLQAELISIAGNYKISEDLKGTVRNTPVQIHLQNHTLIIQNIV
ncbi:MAG: septum site-determining protein MinC [Methylococcaceae bacterium]